MRITESNEGEMSVMATMPSYIPADAQIMACGVCQKPIAVFTEDGAEYTPHVDPADNVPNDHTMTGAHTGKHPDDVR